MAVQVTHSALKYESDTRIVTEYDSNSWFIDEGHLTIGDSLSNPEAAFAPGHWFSIRKDKDTTDED